jgi:hypothetical protein
MEMYRASGRVYRVEYCRQTSPMVGVYTSGIISLAWSMSRR